MVGTYNSPIANKGRRGDTMVAHVTRGEQIVPKQVLDANPVIAHLITQAIRNAGADPDQYKVGSGMSHNPETGHPEFGFFSSIFKSKIFKAVAPIVLGAINPALGAAAGAALGASNGGGVLGGVTGAAGGYFGGSALSGGISGLSTTAASGIGPVGQGGVSGFISGASGGLSGAAGAISSALGIGSGAVSGASNLLSAASLFGAPQQQQAIESQKISSPSSAPYNPKKPAAIATPASLSQMSSFDPEQQRSALATKGLNGGLGADENAYYRNLLQRSLIGDGNKVNTTNPNFLMPIESTYFSQQGQNTSDVMKFLQGISG